MRAACLLTVSHSIPCIFGGGDLPNSAGCRSPWMQTPSGCRLPWPCDLWCMLGCWEANTPPPPSSLWTEWHTGVKTLPGPKTSFAGDKNRFRFRFRSVWMGLNVTYRCRDGLPRPRCPWWWSLSDTGRTRTMSWYCRCRSRPHSKHTGRRPVSCRARTPCRTVAHLQFLQKDGENCSWTQRSFFIMLV